MVLFKQKKEIKELFGFITIHFGYLNEGMICPEPYIKNILYDDKKYINLPISKCKKKKTIQQESNII